MEGQEENKTKLKFLDEVVEFSKRVESLTDDLRQLLRSKNSRVLDPIRPIIEPRSGAVTVLAFYDAYLSAAKAFEDIGAKIDASDLFKEDNNVEVEIEDLEALKILDLLTPFISRIEELEKNSNIKIVAKLIDSASKKLDKYLEVVVNAALSALKRLPRVVDKLDVYSRFILKHCDDEEYLRQYVRIFQSRLNFVGIEDNKRALLQQTDNLTKHFNMVKELNSRILGKRVAKSINKGVVRQLVLDLKVIMAKLLARMDKSHKPKYIPFLILLYSRLRHHEGDMVEEIEELFELKPEITKLIFNCFIQFFGHLDLIEKPNSKLEAEELTDLLATILDGFSICKSAKREWVSSFGRSFGVSDYEDLNSNFSEKCLHKITTLGEQLDVKERSIYIINNVSSLKKYLTKFMGLTTKQLVYKNCETIVGLIKIEIGSKSPEDAYTYLLKELSEVQKYSLPEEERLYISQSIRAMVEDRMSKRQIQGNPQLLLEAISNVYTGNMV